MNLFKSLIINLISASFFIIFLYLYVESQPYQIWNLSYIVLSIFTFFSSFFFAYILNIGSGRPIYVQCFKILGLWSSIFIILAIIGFLTKTNYTVSRLALGTTFISTVILNILIYLIFKKFFYDFSSSKSLLIIYDKDKPEIFKKISTDYGINKKVFYKDQVDNEINSMKPEAVILIMSTRRLNYIDEFMYKYLNYPFELIWYPRNEDKYAFEEKYFSNSDGKGYLINTSPLSYNINSSLKRAFDFFVSFFAITILSPLFVFISLAIVLTSKGSPIYVQDRHGLNGQKFKIFKFRTMRFEENDHFIVASRGDRRITYVGRILRRLSLDELPQLFNVFFGQMSLVGPRPHAVEMNDEMNQKIDGFMARHKVKPGITGLAQIKGYRGGDELEHMKKRLNYDLKYINKWSLLLDIKILLKTIPSLVKDKAY